MTNKVLVRFENLDAIGCYGARECIDFIHEYSEEKHPDAFSDKRMSKVLKQQGIYEIYGWYFAFNSKSMARRWFDTEALRKLHSSGIVVSEYVCKKKDTILGTNQIVFRSHESKQSFSILEYFGIKP